MGSDYQINGALPAILTPLSAAFVHAGMMHLALNMVILIYCGRMVEPVLGSARFIVLYGAGAYAAAGAQWLADPHTDVPMVGASGAISALVAVYSLYFSRQKVRPIGPVPAPVVRALWLGAAWVLIQLAFGIMMQADGTSIATAAHIGGFLFGLLAARPLLHNRFGGQGGASAL
ncbi:MAG: rhomboid family intramembrane serine protease [Alphaproteobacteria bacterium]|nr:rhomboid family intramembrane serine protease [Alphaproteobacteria bacterium]